MFKSILLTMAVMFASQAYSSVVKTYEFEFERGEVIEGVSRQIILNNTDDEMLEMLEDMVLNNDIVRVKIKVPKGRVSNWSSNGDKGADREVAAPPCEVEIETENKGDGKANVGVKGVGVGGSGSGSSNKTIKVKGPCGDVKDILKILFPPTGGGDKDLP